MTVRVGFVGCGGHATQTIYPALRLADLRLVATCDLDPGLAERNALRFGAERWHTSIGDLLAAGDLDALIVVGPPALHVEGALAGLERGLPVFIEKPPGDTLEQALKLQEAARRARRPLMVGFMKRFALAYQKAKRIMARPDFGTPRVLRLNYSHWNYRPLRGHLAFMSTHALDLARHFMGDVRAGAVYKRQVDGQHVIAVLLEHAPGGVSQVTLSALEPRVQESLEVSGDSTVIQVSNLTELRYHRRAPGFAEAVDTDETMAGLWHPDFTIPIPQSDSLVLQGYAGELQEFAGAVAGGSAVTPDIADGVEAMRLLEAIESAPEGVSSLELPVVAAAP